MNYSLITVKDDRLFLEGFIAFLHDEFGVRKSLIKKKLRELDIKSLSDLVEEIDDDE